MAKGARRRPRRRAWQHGGSALRRECVSGHGVARGAAWEVHRARAVLVHEKREREGGQRGEVHGAEHSDEEELTPVSDSRGREASHGLPRRAQGARGGDRAAGGENREMGWQRGSLTPVEHVGELGSVAARLGF